MHVAAGGGGRGAEPRLDRLARRADAALSPESRQQIMQLLGQIDALSAAEKLLLYLKLPTGPPPLDPLKQPVNPLGSRAEIHQTVMWIQTHLEVDPEISLPKQDVYDEYSQYCTSTKMKPLSTADFGKVMKQVYPCVKPRRLGTRGNSRYCYAGMRKRVKLEVPQLPDLGEKLKTMEIPTVKNDLLIAASQLIREWAEKILGLKFGDLCELAHHLIEKDFVDSSSSSAHTLKSNATGSNDGSEITDSKNPDFQQKSQQRGVIKQLKRKIQSQPQSTQSKIVAVAKNTKLHELEHEENEDNSPEQVQLPCASSSIPAVPDFSVKRETDILSPDYNNCQSSSHIVDRSKEFIPNKDSDSLFNDFTYLRTFNVNQPRESSHNVAVNLAQPYNSRMRYSPQHMMNTVKTTPLPTRHVGYNDLYKFENLHGHEISQPTNLSINNYMNYSSSDPILHYPPAQSNLPINLSNNNSENNANVPKLFKSPVYNKSHEQNTPKCEDSLNLSTSNRRDNWHLQQQPLPSPPTKLPLPGKKMILETYNNENHINSSQSWHSNQVVKPSLISPGKIQDAINRGEYLPKKMRATESFSGKMAASRLVSNISTELQQIEPDKYNKTLVNKVPEEYTQLSSKLLQSNNVPNVDLNSESNKNILTNSPSELKLESESCQPASEYLSPSSSGELAYQKVITKSEKIRVKSSSPKKTPKNCKSAKKTLKTKLPVGSTKMVSPAEKQATRGRPRKKSLSKAKYSRRQPNLGSNIVHPQCDHTKHPKRSSDSCCSLTESINIHKGIICVEKHSEILNRERVSSICNMDKHALDDYLNESNSQEHEEELMKYFHPNCDNQTDDINIKVNIPNAEESDISRKKGDEIIAESTTVSAEQNACNLTPTQNIITSSNANNTSRQESDFLDQGLDINDDHSQSKTYKLSQLRELLKKNLNHNSSGSAAATCVDNISGDIDSKISVKANPNCFNHTSDGIESAFTSISRRMSANNTNIEFKEGSAAVSLNMLSKRQIANASDRPSSIHGSSLINTGLNVRRRVSFENPISEHNDITSYSNQDSPVYIRGQQNIPQSPTSRLQHFNFMPISPGPLSPVNSNKNSPIVSCKRAVSPTKAAIAQNICTSPVSLSSSASPFVSPRNTPVPRSRIASHGNPVPSKLQVKKFSRLGINKSLNLNDKMRPIKEIAYNSHLKHVSHEVGNFIIPNDQSSIPRSPNFPTKSRNFPMSAPPSPNILAPKYKLNFAIQNQPSISHMQSVIQVHPGSQSIYSNQESMNVQTHDSTQSDPRQPLSADPLSHEVSQFFTDTNISLEDSTNSLRSQSVPLHQNNAVPENNLMFFNQDSSVNSSSTFLSYNHTPCSSITPTPVPREFCDFVNLNETCDSITEVGLNSENLDKIYNVLDSNVEQTLHSVNDVVKQNDILMNADENLALSNFSQEISNSTNNIIGPLLSVNVGLDTMSKQIQYNDQLQQVFGEQSATSSNEYLKRSNSSEIDMNDVPIENRYYISRSVPSTPLPCGKTTLPNFDLRKIHISSQNHYRGNYNNRKLLSSKSVPSTPLLTDDRNVFNYSNRDFLINGNSVDPNISSTFNDKEISNGDRIDSSFLNEPGDLMEEKGNSSVLAGLSSSPLPETIDIVNNDLVPFNDDCMDIASELPTFTEQGISSENDLLGDLDIM